MFHVEPAAPPVCKGVRRTAKWGEGMMPYLKKPVGSCGTLIAGYTTKYVGKRMTVLKVLAGGKKYIVRPEGGMGTLKVSEDELTDQASLDIPQGKGGQK
jgi:hypothetical protein